MLFEHKILLKLSIGYIGAKELYFICKKNRICRGGRTAAWRPAARKVCRARLTWRAGKDISHVHTWFDIDKIFYSGGK